MANARSAKGITARLSSQAAPNLDILRSLGDTFARAASGYLQDSELARDMFNMQEQWISETTSLIREWDEGHLDANLEDVVRTQLKKLHGYIYVNSAPTIP